MESIRTTWYTTTNAGNDGYSPTTPKSSKQGYPLLDPASSPKTKDGTPLQITRAKWSKVIFAAILQILAPLAFLGMLKVRPLIGRVSTLRY